MKEFFLDNNDYIQILDNVVNGDGFVVYENKKNHHDTITMLYGNYELKGIKTGATSDWYRHKGNA